MARGMMVYLMGCTMDGRHGDCILLAPPFIADATVIDAVTLPVKQQAA